ncbi:sensor histidine kinase [Christiangramia flava]|nr:HAMP domain-containing sensor histidine kinase [Christiangramia flava]
MKKLYNRIPYLLSVVIVAIIGIQIIWSYTEYQKNTMEFKSDIQKALDVAIDNYFIDFAKDNSVSLRVNNAGDFNSEKITIKGQNRQIIDKINGDSLSSASIPKASDSLKMLNNIRDIYISINEDSINFTKLKGLLNSELDRKNYDISYKLNHLKNDSIYASSRTENFTSGDFTVQGKSTYLKSRESIELLFPNAIIIILKKSLFSIVISLLLMVCILFALFYMQWVIKQQKQLSEIKDDLISNITHEFKTPISTIGAALESIRYFNTNNDIEKTNRYLDYSDQQLKKLETMVDQLMDTALLKTENWILEKRQVNIHNWAAEIIDNYKMNAQKKAILLNISKDSKSEAYIEPFHLGNCLGALIDNAVKYGGDKIEILIDNGESLTLQVIDEPGHLTKNQSEKIFDKFYRVPQGNLHNVKGYGVGLYYVKKIAEKHGGTAEVILKNNSTSFIISVPNE